MGLYFFDLKDGIPVRDRKGHKCANDKEAISYADNLAQRIGTDLPGVAAKGSYISVLNEDGREIHRAPIKGAERDITG